MTIFTEEHRLYCLLVVGHLEHAHNTAAQLSKCHDACHLLPPPLLPGRNAINECL